MPNKYLDSVGLAEYTSLVKADLATKAPLASPALTGTPTAPTPTAGDDSTKIATTEFVQDAIDTANGYTDTEIAAEVTRADGAYLPFTGGTLTGVVNGVTPTAGDDSTKIATTEFVNDAIDTEITSEIAAEVTRADGAYLPFTGGSITGNLSVSGTITGDVTGDLTGNADTATNATNDANGNQIDTTYLPLTGGTMTGNIVHDKENSNFVIGKSQTNGSLIAYGGSNSYTGGASLYLYGKDNATYPGRFYLAAHNGTNSIEFQGRPDGTLTWGGKNVLTDATVGTVVSQSFTSTTTLSVNTVTNLGSITLSAGTWVVTGHIRYATIISGRQFIGLNTVLYIGAETDGTVIHYSDTASNSTLSLSTTRIFVLSQSTTIYLVGYATSSCVSANNNLSAVRII